MFYDEQYLDLIVFEKNSLQTPKTVNEGVFLNPQICKPKIVYIMGLFYSTLMYGTVMRARARKIKRLEESGVIKGYLAIIDAEKFGNMARSALTIKLSGGVEIDRILDELIQIEDICNIFETMGNYDILLTCCNRDESQIYELIKKIRSMDGVMFVDFTTIVSRRKILKNIISQ